MTIHDKMIGEHPKDGTFLNCTECHDTKCTDQKRHHHLSEKGENQQEAIETTANWLITYHLSKSKKMVLLQIQ